jgi:hypothetical protein
MIMTISETKLKELQKKLDSAFEDALQDPNYRKSHSLRLSEN